jgi:DNA mismatch repair protein MutS2
VRKALTRARQPLDALEPLIEQVEELEAEVEAPVVRRPPAGVRGRPAGRKIRRAIQLGDQVWLRALDTLGVVGSLGEEQAEVQVGNLRVRARLSELELVGGELESGPPEPQPQGEAVEPPAKIVKAESPGAELDIRGRRVDEALDVLETYIDSAYLAGLPYVRIIHGKGTGRLREAVRRALQDHPHVRSNEPGLPNEGGDGVTVAKLAA